MSPTGVEPSETTVRERTVKGPHANDPTRMEHSDRLTAIVAAMPEELQPLVARTRVHQTLDLGRCKVHLGTLGTARVALACTGDGRQRAEAGAAALLEHFPANLLVVLGIAGGLSPSLVPGSVLVARSVRHGSQAVPPPATEWIDRALLRKGTTGGTVVSTRRILCTPAAKAEVRSDLSADGPAVVDLESSVYAEIAARAGIPYVVLRVVCDAADETLPFDLNLCRDASGSIRRGEVLRRILARPAALGHLWELRKRTAAGAERLAQLAEELLNEGSS